MQLDKFYAQKEVAKQCVDFLKEKVNLSNDETAGLDMKVE